MGLRRVHQLLFMCSCSLSALPGPRLWRNMGKPKERGGDEDHCSKVLSLRWFGWRQVPVVWWEIGGSKALPLTGGRVLPQVGVQLPGRAGGSLCVKTALRVMPALGT